jgi:transglutaminase-like putative cysteine protease
LEADIEITPQPAIECAGIAWEAVAEDVELPAGVAEFRLPTRLTGTDALVFDYARRHFTPGADMMHATTAMMRDLYAIFRYRPGTTTTTTTGPAALARREGVCQDYSHAMLAALRALRLPARYVSGYLRSQILGGETAYSGTEQTHAWVSVWLGQRHGWVDFDPTNNLIVSDEHVTLAWGRDFTDVSPTCGIILGGRRHTLKVSVVLAPVG